MELISRDKALMCATGCFPVDSERADECKTIAKRLSDCPSAFEGMTNGEVLKAIFPDCIDYHGIIEVKTHLDMGMTFRRSWWDSPYKGQDGMI